MSVSAVAVAVAVVRSTCSTPTCLHLPWRRGLCSSCYRRQRGVRLARAVMVRTPGAEDRLAVVEPPDLAWLTEPAPVRRLRRRALERIDRLLFDIEEFNWYADPADPAPADLVRTYHVLRHGTLPDEVARNPSGAELHAAALRLEELFMRHVSFAPADTLSP